MNAIKYESFGQLQKSGHLKFKQGVTNDILQKIRKVKILKQSLDRINMKLDPDSLKFKQGVINDVLQKIRKVKILNYALDKINMKLDPDSIQLQSNTLPNGQQVTQHLIWALSFVESIHLEEVQLFKVEDIYTSKLLLTFASINFHQLEYLNLNSCNLGSIEFLTFLDLPQLKRLILNDNDLTNLNVFAKCTFPKLYWIDLIENQIKDAKGLHRSLLGPKLGVLEVTQKQKQTNLDTFTYLSTWFFKLPFEFINYIRKRDTLYLFKKNHMDKALRKYPDATFR